MSIKTGRAGAFTLVEVLVTLALTVLVAAVIATFIFYSSRSFVAMTNYTDMNQKSQVALDKMSKEIRQASRVTAFSPTKITFQNPDGSTFGFNYDAADKKLIRSGGGSETTYLTDCVSLKFWVFQHTMKSNTFECYDPSYLSDARIIEMTWRCSRDVLGSKATTDSAQSAKVVLRNQ